MSKELQRKLQSELKSAYKSSLELWGDLTTDGPPQPPKTNLFFPDLKTGLPGLNMFFRFDPHKDLQYDYTDESGDIVDLTKFVSHGWSYPDRPKASKQLRKNGPKDLYHLAYTVLTHHTRYEGHAWSRWADANGIDRECAYYHINSNGVSYSPNWNTSHAYDPTMFRSGYLVDEENFDIKWIDTSKVSEVNIPKGKTLYLGFPEYFDTVLLGSSIQSLKVLQTALTSLEKQFGIWQYDSYLYWYEVPFEGFVKFGMPDWRRSDGTIRPYHSLKEAYRWHSRIDKPKSGPGNWLMNPGDPEYRKFILEDRPRYINSIFREHRAGDEITRKQFDGLFIDDTMLDLLNYEKSPYEFIEDFSQQKYHEDIGSLCKELWEKVNDEHPNSYVHANVGNWKFRELQHFTKHCPSIYLDRMINVNNLTIDKIITLEESLHSLVEQCGNDLLVTIDGLGTDANNLSEKNKKLFLAAYYLVVPDPTNHRWCLSWMHNGDKDRSDWVGRHWHEDALINLGKPKGRFVAFSENQLLRNFEGGTVRVQRAEENNNLTGLIQELSPDAWGI